MGRSSSTTNELVELLQTSENNNATSDIISDATILLQNILNFNCMVLIHFWHDILRRLDRVQKRLQDPTMNFKEAFHDLDSLATNLAEIRDNVCQDAITKATLKCEQWCIDIQIRGRRRQKMPGELSQNADLSAQDEICRVMKSVLDCLEQELKSRFTHLTDLNSKFGFLLNIENLLKGECDMDIETNCKILCEFYDTDTDEPGLNNDIFDCKMLLLRREDFRPKTPIDLLAFIIS